MSAIDAPPLTFTVTPHALADLRLACHRCPSRVLGDSQLPVTAEELLFLVQQPGGTVVEARQGGRTVGWVAYELDADRVQLLELALTKGEPQGVTEVFEALVGYVHEIADTACLPIMVDPLSDLGDPLSSWWSESYYSLSGEPAYRTSDGWLHTPRVRQPRGRS